MNKSQKREIVQKDRQKTLAEQHITQKTLAEEDNQHANIKKKNRNYGIEFKTRGQEIKTKRELLQSINQRMDAKCLTFKKEA